MPEIALPTLKNQEKIMKMLQAQDGVSFSPVMGKKLVLQNQTNWNTEVFKKDENYIYTLYFGTITKLNVSDLSPTNVTFTADSTVSLKNIFIKEDFLITGGLIKVGDYYQIIIYKLNKDDLSIIQQKQYAVSTTMSRSDSCLLFVNDNYICLTCVTNYFQLPIFDINTLNFVKNPFSNRTMIYSPVIAYGDNKLLVLGNGNGSTASYTTYSFSTDTVYQSATDADMGVIKGIWFDDNFIYFMSNTSICKYSITSRQKVAVIKLNSLLQFAIDSTFYLLDSNYKFIKCNLNLFRDGGYEFTSDFFEQSKTINSILIESLESDIYFLTDTNKLSKAKVLHNILGYERIDE